MKTCLLAPVAECAAPSKLYDHQPERQWRQLDACQYRTILHAEPPRAQCPTHGVRVVKLPWAEPSSRFAALFEAFAIAWLKAVSAGLKQQRSPFLTTAATLGLASGHTNTPASQCRLRRLWRDKANSDEVRRSEHAATVFSPTADSARSAFRCQIVFLLPDPLQLWLDPLNLETCSKSAGSHPTAWHVTESLAHRLDRPRSMRSTPLLDGIRD
jgi:hypothetical protein